MSTPVPPPPYGFRGAFTSPRAPSTLLRTTVTALGGAATPTEHNVVVPRIGGILLLDATKGEAFTGGSNLTGHAQLIPQHPHQRRCVKFTAQTDFQSSMEHGMEFKLGGKNEKSKIDLVFWFQALATNLVKFGLDTVFRVPTDSWTKEIFIAQDWGKITPALVNPWIQQLIHGVLDLRTRRSSPPCQYDHQNLHYSGVFILHSCTQAHHLSLLEELGPTPTGPAILVHIVKTRHAVKTSKQRELITSLGALKLNAEKGGRCPGLQHQA